MKERVIVAVEDATFGSLISEYVCSRPWHSGTEFTVLHVTTPPPDDEVAQPYRDLAAERLAQIADEIVKQVTNRIQNQLPACSVAQLFLQGHPKTAILQCAEELQADTIILGQHGAANSSRKFPLGSTTTAVTANAPCNVIIVRPIARQLRTADADEFATVSNKSIGERERHRAV